MFIGGAISNAAISPVPGAQVKTAELYVCLLGLYTPAIYEVKSVKGSLVAMCTYDDVPVLPALGIQATGTMTCFPTQ